MRTCLVVIEDVDIPSRFISEDDTEATYVQSDQQKIIEEHQRWCNLIAERRKDAGLSREALAAMAGIDASTVRNIEKGRIRAISTLTMNRLRSVTQLNLPLSLDEEGAHTLSPSRR